MELLRGALVVSRRARSKKAKKKILVRVWQ